MTKEAIVLLGIGALAGACEHGVDPTRRARVNEVILEPADTTVEHPAGFRYRVTLLDDNGQLIHESRPMTFDATNQAVVNVSSGGWVTTERPGNTEITVLVGGTPARASLFVINAEPSPPGQR